MSVFCQQRAILHKPPLHYTVTTLAGFILTSCERNWISELLLTSSHVKNINILTEMRKSSGKTTYKEIKIVNLPLKYSFMHSISYLKKKVVLKCIQIKLSSEENILVAFTSVQFVFYFWVTRGQIPPQDSSQVRAFQTIIAQTKVTAAQAAVQPHSAHITRLDFSARIWPNTTSRDCAVYTLITQGQNRAARSAAIVCMLKCICIVE